MIGMVSVAPPGIAEIAAQAATLALPAKSKAVLKDIADQLAALAAARNDFAAAKAQIDAARSAADKFKAELDARAQGLTDRDTALRARVAAFEKVVSEFEGRLAANAATLESSA